MAQPPSIGPPGEATDFHDSSLLHLAYLPVADRVEVVVSTPNQWGAVDLWQVTLSGVLRINFENLGDGEPPLTDAPPEVYDIYDDPNDSETARWLTRLADLDVRDPEVHCIVLASSFLRGWGENEELEGIKIVCRKVSVDSAPERFRGQEYARPRIPAGE